jgi:protoheme IX farnesyltransferase
MKDNFGGQPVLDGSLAAAGNLVLAPTGVSARKLAAYIELTKPRLSSLILLVALSSYWVASADAASANASGGWRMAALLIGTGLLAGGIFALNQYLERDVDARMRRTGQRPLPTGRLTPGEALWFGAALVSAAVVSLALLVNLLCGFLALATAGSYLFLYTPLKRITPHATLIGAFPGAAPPLLGWAAARNDLGLEAWTLFAILFLWQFPHFHSIGWLYREDYARAGIRFWPVIESPKGRVTSSQIVGFAAVLLPVSLMPAVLGISGLIYAGVALGIGSGFLWLGVRAAMRSSDTNARRLLLASVLYLPALFTVMVFDK